MRRLRAKRYEFTLFSIQIKAYLTDTLLNNQQATSLQRAAYMGHTSTIEALIDGGASLDLQDSEGSTALHKASAQVRNKSPSSVSPPSCHIDF